MSDQINESSIVNNKHQPCMSRGITVFLFFIVVIAFLVGAMAYGQLMLKTKKLTQTVQVLAKQQTSNQETLTSLQQTVNDWQKMIAPNKQQEQVTTELYSRLSLLDNQIDQLPLFISPDQTKASASVEKLDATLHWWQRGWQRLWLGLQKIIIVHSMTADTEIITAPAEKMFLYQNLHAQLSYALWGVLHHNVTVYQLSLTRMIAWIERYFLVDAEATQQVLQALQSLQRVDVTLSSGTSASVAMDCSLAKNALRNDAVATSALRANETLAPSSRASEASVAIHNNAIATPAGKE